MKRIDVEQELREQRPGETESPAWIRTRVLSRVESEPQLGSRSRVSRLGAGVIGGAALAALALSIVLWPASHTVPDTEWTNAQTVKIDLALSDRLPTTNPLSTEARRLREDMVQITSLVSVPIRKLNDAMKQY